MFEKIKDRARALKTDAVALYIAVRDKRTPMLARLIATAVVAYALSPIDLIPDFIPVFGYLDDLLIVPLGIMLAVRLIPQRLMAEYRAQASIYGRLPSNPAGAFIVVGLWVGGLSALGWWAFSYFGA